MKKIIELEERWKSYKYRSFIFYIFICVFVVFIAFVGLFIKNQYGKYSNIDNKQIVSKSVLSEENTSTAISASSVNNVNNNVVQSNIPIAINDNQSANAYPSISFVCRKVMVDKLMVRKEPSFKSQPVGHYSKNGIFCADDRGVNGLLQTNNGWISSSDSFSEVVEVNMFVDSGFHKYQSTPRILAQSPMEEINVLDDKPTQAKPVQYPSTNEVISDSQNTTNMVQNIQSVNSKPLVNISSEKITKEREIELKITDFKKTNSYVTAIEIAEYYFNIKDYSNSVKWALNASEADSKGRAKSQSFIIYAKSLYASGKEEQAIEVLSRYIAKTNSRDAVEALENIRQGII